jgi:hypothetical protein
MLIDNVKHKEIAKIFGIDSSGISNIHRKKYWNHISLGE